MSSLRSIHLAIDQATRQRDGLAAALAHAQNRLNVAQEQMRQLESYGAETDARWVSPAACSVSVELIRHRYQFMDRLQHAMGMHQGVLGGLVSQLEHLRRQWVAAQVRLAGLERVLEQRMQALDQVRRRRDQARTDEFAVMQYARRRAVATQGENDEH